MSDGAKKLKEDASSPANVINDILRHKALETLKIRSKVDDIVLEEVANKDDFLYGPMMAFLLIHGDSFRVTFKVHYYLKTAKSLAAALLGRPAEEITVDLTKDFMKEFCNIVGGEVRASITRLNVRVGVTLPFIISGFDEVLFSDEISPSSVMDYWQLKWNGGFVVCSSVIDIRDPQLLQGIETRAEDENDTAGEIVFL